jgi:hypothetical protein
MKLVAFSLIFLLASCTADNENVNIKNEPPKAEFTQNQINWQGATNSSLILIDYNGITPDTLLKTTQRNINVSLLKRGYFEVKITNNTPSTNSILIKSNNTTILNQNYNINQNGCIIQFFNK